MKRIAILVALVSVIVMSLAITAAPAFAGRGGVPGPNPEASKGISISQCASAVRSDAKFCQP